MERIGLKTVMVHSLRFNNMQTISAEEFKNKYGSHGLSSFQAPPKPTGIGADISNAFQGGLSQVEQGYQQAKTATNPIQKTEAGLQMGAGAVGAAFSPLAPVTKYIGQGIDTAANTISDIPQVQQFAQTKAGQTASRVAGDTANTATLLSLKGAEPAAAGVGAGARAVGDTTVSLGKGAAKTADYLGHAAKDIVPTTQGVISHQVTKALDLAPGDIDKLHKSTGNNVGPWLADNNLIGKNKAETQANIKGFFDQNYTQVRNEIGKVDTIYRPNQVPRYTDALKQIDKKIDGVPGLEKESVEVSNLLAKKDISLSDVQHVKELLDNHFNLYKVTGDVGEGVAKEGLANIRSDLKNFIEKQVKDNTGEDIGQMNNNVSTAKSLNDFITTRSPKGLTASNLKLGDLGIFGVGMSFGGPLAGAALVFGKKLMETPTVRLRIARYMDQLDDAKKAKIQATMQEGKIPPEFNQFIKKPTGGSKK